MGTLPRATRSIKAEDLDPGFSFTNVGGKIDLTQIPETISRAADLKKHLDSTSAHAASAITVKQDFVTFVASNVQEALEKIDSKLTDEVVNRQGGQGDLNTTTTTLRTNLDTETANRTAAVSSEAATRAAADTSLQSSVNTAQSTADTALTNAAAAQSTANTAVTNAAAAQSTANGAASAASTAQLTADSKVSKSGDTMSGDLNMNGHNITNPGTVEGYHVAATFSNHESRITALEGHAVNFSEVQGQIAPSQVPFFMRPVAFGVLQASGSGCGGGLTVLAGYNISSASGGGAWRIELPFFLPANKNLIIVTDQVTTGNGDQDSLDHRCIWGPGTISTGNFGENNPIVARCSVSSVCNGIPNKAVSFVVYRTGGVEEVGYREDVRSGFLFPT